MSEQKKQARNKKRSKRTRNKSQRRKAKQAKEKAEKAKQEKAKEEKAKQEKEAKEKKEKEKERKQAEHPLFKPFSNIQERNMMEKNLLRSLDANFENFDILRKVGGTQLYKGLEERPELTHMVRESLNYFLKLGDEEKVSIIYSGGTNSSETLMNKDLKDIKSMNHNDYNKIKPTKHGDYNEISYRIGKEKNDCYTYHSDQTQPYNVRKGTCIMDNDCSWDDQTNKCLDKTGSVSTARGDQRLSGNRDFDGSGIGVSKSGRALKMKNGTIQPQPAAKSITSVLQIFGDLYKFTEVKEVIFSSDNIINRLLIAPRIININEQIKNILPTCLLINSESSDIDKYGTKHIQFILSSRIIKSGSYFISINTENDAKLKAIETSINQIQINQSGGVVAGAPGVVAGTPGVVAAPVTAPVGAGAARPVAGAKTVQDAPGTPFIKVQFVTNKDIQTKTAPYIIIVARIKFEHLVKLCQQLHLKRYPNPIIIGCEIIDFGEALKTNATISKDIHDNEFVFDNGVKDLIMNSDTIP